MLCSVLAKNVPCGNKGVVTSYNFPGFFNANSQPVALKMKALDNLLRLPKHVAHKMPSNFSVRSSRTTTNMQRSCSAAHFVKTLIALDANVSHIPHLGVSQKQSSKSRASSLWGKKPLLSHIGSLVSDVTRQNIIQYSHTATKNVRSEVARVEHWPGGRDRQPY